MPPDPSAPTPDQVQAALAAAGLPQDPRLTRSLAAFLAALLQANTHLNLTRITDPADALTRHLIEPLAGWRLLAPRLPPGPLFDVGSGGGAPGLPIAIVDPQRQVVLIESRRRKADYLQATVTALALPNVRVIHARAEVVARGPDRQTAAAAIARAVAPLPAALELLLPLLAVQGWATLFAGPALTAQLPDATAAAPHLGADPPTVLDVTWTDSTRAVKLALAHKSAPTPDRFPRSPAAIGRPLR